MQLTLDLDPGIADSYPTCREFVASRLHQLGKPQKAVAADMDYSPSDLSRKLAQSPDDSRRFTLDDLEKYMETQNDYKPVLYLVEKYFNKYDRVTQLEKELEMLRSTMAPKNI